MKSEKQGINRIKLNPLVRDSLEIMCIRLKYKARISNLELKRKKMNSRVNKSCFHRIQPTMTKRFKHNTSKPMGIMKLDNSEIEGTTGIKLTQKIIGLEKMKFLCRIKSSLVSIKNQHLNSKTN